MAKITKDERNKSGWVMGTHKGHKFEAKVYDEPSDYGVGGGRTSKILVRDKHNKEVGAYERDYDKKPEEIHPMIHSLARKLEAIPASHTKVSGTLRKEHHLPYWGESKWNAE